MVYTKDNAPPAPGLEELPLRQSVSQYGITWSFDRKYPCGQFANGDYYVVGPVTITAITPPPGNGRNGSELNPATGEYDGYDSRFREFKAELTAAPPIAMKPGDSLVSTISHEQRGGHKHIFPHNENSSSLLKTAAVLTCLGQPVPPDTFRPSYCGHQAKLYRYSDLHLELLPSVKPTKSLPDLALYERIFERPWIDHIYSWHSRDIHPTENMPDYGREISRAVSIASLLLCCDFTPEQKQKLLTELVQYGIDLYGCIGRGLKGWPAQGGFGNGRKWPIVFAGILFQDQDMQRPQAEFGEDQHTAFGKCWTGAGVVFTGQYPNVGHVQIDRGPYEHLHPSRWPGDDPTMSEGYRRCCTSISWIGEALAARMMRAEKVWDHDAFFAYVDRWMTEDDTQAIEEIKVAQGVDYAKPWMQQRKAWDEDEFVNEMWAAYRSLPGLPPIEVPGAQMAESGTVEVGKNREFLVNGKPFFPLMLFGQGPGAIGEAVSIGINTFTENGSNVRNAEFLDKLAQSGLYGVFGADVEIIGHSHLLGMIHLDEPDRPTILKDIKVVPGEGVSTDSHAPLRLLVDGNTSQGAVLSPMEGAQVTVTLQTPVTVQSLAVWSTTGISAAAKEVVFLGDGKEILRATLEHKEGQQKLELKQPATFRELTFRVLSAHPAEVKWGVINEIQAFDEKGKEVALYDRPKVPARTSEQVEYAYRWMKGVQKTRPVFLTLSPAFMKSADDWDRATKERLYPEYLKSCDVAAVRIDAAGPLERAVEAVEELRAMAGRQRPVCIWVPLTGRLPEQAGAQVWMAIIRGTTGIGYYVEGQKAGQSFALDDRMRAELKRLNEQITQLAPAIVAEPAQVEVEVSMGDGVPCHFKATQLEGVLYMFAQNLDAKGRAGKAAIHVEGLGAGTQVEVVDEGRVIVADKGQFTDEFRPLAVHIYKLMK